MTSGLSADEKRVLNPRPFRHFRKTYSLTEFRLGLSVLFLLAVIGVWIAWKGAHPDPALFAEPKGLPGAADVDAAPVARGAMPASLAPEGWKEGGVGRFDASNLYEKINGRADYFTSRGFKSLTALTLTKPGGATAVDLELYEHGSPENAASVFNGEKPADAKVVSRDGTSFYVSRNALFLTRGGHYLRAIGSDESADVMSALDTLRARFERDLVAGERPASHDLFGPLGVAPDKITFQEENAFSFGFAKGVHVALLPDETELFVMAAPDAASAPALASQFEKGFLGYGEIVMSRGAASEPPGTSNGATWVKDRYLSTFARAIADGALVAGVRGAPSLEAGEKALASLRKALAALPPATREKLRPTAKPSEKPYG